MARQTEVLKDYAAHGLQFKAGERYLLEDPTLAHLLMMGVAGKVTDVEIQRNPSSKDVLITRSGGFGDILFMTPTIKAFLALGSKVTVCCHRNYADALSAFPQIGYIPYPMRVGEVLPYGYHVWLEGVIEFAPEPERHAVDLIAERAGVELGSKELIYSVRPADMQWAKENFPRTRKPRVGVQLMASAPTRTYPHELMHKALLGLLMHHVEIAVFGSPGSIELSDKNPAVYNIAAAAKTFGQSCAVLAECDAVIAPDSALCHVAGALGLPTVALYAPFPWQARTAYAPSIRALSGNLKCAPCFWHGRGSAYPPHGPCAQSGRCDALATIAPERIVRETMRLLEEKRTRGGLVASGGAGGISLGGEVPPTTLPYEL